MSDLYTIAAWAATTQYEQDDIVSNGGYYYYARSKHTSTSSFSMDNSNGLWKGNVTINGQIKPYFEWVPSYNYSLDIKPTVKTISFGDGYKIDLNDGVNNILLPITLQFEDRNLNEYRAILHFLDARKGSQRFYFTAPAPFNVLKLFVCPSWRPSQSFYNKYSVEVNFEERIV